MPAAILELERVPLSRTKACQADSRTVAGKGRSMGGGGGATTATGGEAGGVGAVAVVVTVPVTLFF
jgi:hypothetical protein